MKANIWIISFVVLFLARSSSAQPTIAAEPQYLLFQIFAAATAQDKGVFTKTVQKSKYAAAAVEVLKAVGEPAMGTGRYVGISIGPVTMSLTEDEARSMIRDLFDVALSQNVAVALHLDDYMFWNNAKGADGKLLRNNPANVEWKDWQGTPAEALDVKWLRNHKLTPQMCYESPEIRQFVTHWSKDVIGDEVGKQLTRLEQEGKRHLFAGIITGWETNLAYGYNSLTQLGYSSNKPPTDFDFARERIVQRHIARIAKGLSDAGIERDLIYSHIAPITQADYERLEATNSREKIREIHQSTMLRAFWPAFNDYGNPGFGGYPGGGRFDDIYKALEKYGNRPWAMAEGTNAVLSAGTHTGGGIESPIDWESYLAMNFNHGARIVNLFGGFVGAGAGIFKRTTESTEAVAAYKKFLSGERLIEKAQASAAQSSPAPGRSVPAGAPTNPRAIGDRISKLQERVRVFARSGGDMRKLEPKMKALNEAVNSKDLKKAADLLDEIDRDLGA